MKFVCVKPLKSKKTILFIKGTGVSGPLGRSMADDDGDYGRRALEDGESYVARATGSLGESMWAKAPVIDPETGL